VKSTLVLVRHGESEWNLINKFTGWVDVPLSEKGEKEAMDGGKLIKETNIKFSCAHTSRLKRAIKTLWHVLEESDQMWIPVSKAWELNERHYGGLQGLDKQETVNKHGKEQVLIWRRSYDIPPPPVGLDSEYHPSNDPKYADYEFPKEFTESLATTLERVLPYYKKSVFPQLKEGKNIIIAAHGNSLRALVKYLDDIDESTIAGLNIPTGVPLVYEFDDDMNVIPSKDSIGALRGKYLGDLDAIRAKIEGVKNQTK